jgi:hypothetical protein
MGTFLSSTIQSELLSHHFYNVVNPEDVKDTCTNIKMMMAKLSTIGFHYYLSSAVPLKERLAGPVM